MATVTVFSAARMLEIENAAVVGGLVDANGHLILTTKDNTDIDAGNVSGPKAVLGTTPPANPTVGQLFYDTNNLSDITDLMASANPITSTANWIAAGYGYDTSVTFSLAGGGVTCTWGNANNHLAGVSLSNLVAGESYLAELTVRVPSGSPDVYFSVGWKTSGHRMRIKDRDVTLLLSFTADGSVGVFGVECGGATGTAIVKALKVYTVNQRGFPAYFWDGTAWVETVHVAQKGDIYSRVNTFGDQTVNGNKVFTGSPQIVNPPGSVIAFAGSAAPNGWLLCQGQSVLRADYPDLFTAIGTTYGSADGTHFTLPNLKGRVPVGQDSGQTEFDVLGETGGAKTVTLSVAEMPTHTHTNRSGIGANGPFVLNAPGGGTGYYGINTDVITNNTNFVANDNNGGGGAHNNLQPYIAMNYIIKT